MEHVATRRLVEASAALDTPSRALLNLWLHRRLSDAAIAAMAGLDPEAVTARKLDIAHRLSLEMGVPVDQVLAALSEIVRVPEDTEPDELENVGPALNGDAPAESVPDEPASPVADEPASSEVAEPASSEAAGLASSPGDAGHQRRMLLVLALLVVVIVVVVVILLNTSGSTKHPSRRTAETTTAETTTARPPVATTVGSKQKLKPLSLTVPHATGTATVSRIGSVTKLNLTVAGLRPVSREHYEVWLYNSIIDSHALGTIARGVNRLSFTLPADAARYHQIDISLQPPNYRYDSGASVLRAQNPLG